MSALKKISVAVGVLVSVFALTWFVYYPHSPLGRQEANLKTAAEDRVRVKEALLPLTGTEKVNVEIDTRLGGSLSVFGNVPDERTAETVMITALSIKPSVIVQFQLTVAETNMIMKIVDPNAAPEWRPSGSL